MTLRSTAASVFRDHSLDGVPGSGEHRPIKSDVRSLLGQMGDQIERGLEAASAGVVQRQTWPQLLSITGSYVGQPGRVTGVDAGTHTDPVVGGTVANTGEYTWSASPAGWEWLGALTYERAEDAADEAEANAAGALSELNQYMPYINLFDKEDPDVSPGFVVVWNTGNLSANAIFTASGFVPVEESTEYTISYTQQRAFYDADKVFISGENFGSPATFTTPAGAAYARFTILNTRFQTFQVELGPTLSKFVPYTRHLLASALPFELSLPIENVAFAVASKNLFDKDDPDVTPGFFPAWNTGTLSADALYTASGYVPVTPSTEYTISFSHYRAFYDRDKLFISGTFLGNPATFTTPAGTAFARFSILSTYVDGFQVELGPLATDFQPFGHKINPDVLSNVDSFPPMIVDIVSSSSINLYIKRGRKNCSTYIQWRLARFTDPAKNADVWRTDGVYACTRTISGVITVGDQVFTTGEVENAIKPTGAYDFAGGKIHGNEELTGTPMILIDGAQTSIVAGVYDCSDFQLYQVSEFLTPGSTLGTVFSPAGAPFVTAYKRWQFDADGLKFRARLVPQASVTISTGMIGMVPFTSPLGQTAIRPPYWAPEDISTTGSPIVKTNVKEIQLAGPDWSTRLLATGYWSATSETWVNPAISGYTKGYNDALKGTTLTPGTELDVAFEIDIMKKETA